MLDWTLFLTKNDYRCKLIIKGSDSDERNRNNQD
jgi:hypothetical protein